MLFDYTVCRTHDLHRSDSNTRWGHLGFNDVSKALLPWMLLCHKVNTALNDPAIVSHGSLSPRHRQLSFHCAPQLLY